ncbi:MAG: hypothetical protein WBB07_09050 [Mycobacterium sp.]
MFDEHTSFLDRLRERDQLLAAAYRRWFAPATAVTPTEQRRITVAVCSACRANDVAALWLLLAADVTAVVDTGGAYRVDPEPLCGVEAVSRTLRGFFVPGLETAVNSVNGAAGVLVGWRQRVVAVMVLDVAGGQVQHVWVVLNPDKLRQWS